MRPPNSQPPAEAVPGPTVPEGVRAPLLRLLAKGVTTIDAATQLEVTALTMWRYLDVLRREGVAELRAHDDGRGGKWWRTSSKTRRTAS